MKVGDLVKMKRGYSSHGIVLSVPGRHPGLGPTSEGPVKWVRVLWSDYGPGIEKFRDLEVVK